jgi:hypothetical protein
MEEEYKGYTIKIVDDNDPINPRDDSNYGKMICFHKRYDLGDKTDLTSDNFNGWEELEEHIKKELKAVIVLPLFLYDHSGLSLRTFRHGYHGAWDCGQVGFIYATKESITDINGKTKLTKSFLKKLEGYLIDEVEEYSKYLNGEGYGYEIEKNGEQFDSCYGYNDTDYAIKDAKNVIDGYSKAEKELTLQY